MSAGPKVNILGGGWSRKEIVLAPEKREEEDGQGYEGQSETMCGEGPVKIVDVGLTRKHFEKRTPDVQLEVICINAM